MAAEKWIIRGVAAVVLLGFSLTLVVSVRRNDYSAMAYTMPLMVGLLGYATGVRVIRKNGK